MFMHSSSCRNLGRRCVRRLLMSFPLIFSIASLLASFLFFAVTIKKNQAIYLYRRDSVILSSEHKHMYKVYKKRSASGMRVCVCMCIADSSFHFSFRFVAAAHSLTHVSCSTRSAAVILAASFISSIPDIIYTYPSHTRALIPFGQLRQASVFNGFASHFYTVLNITSRQFALSCRCESVASSNTRGVYSTKVSQ